MNFANLAKQYCFHHENVKIHIFEPTCTTTTTFFLHCTIFSNFILFFYFLFYHKIQVILKNKAITQKQIKVVRKPIKLEEEINFSGFRSLLLATLGGNGFFSLYFLLHLLYPNLFQS